MFCRCINLYDVEYSCDVKSNITRIFCSTKNNMDTNRDMLLVLFGHYISVWFLEWKPIISVGTYFIITSFCSKKYGVFSW